MRRFLIVLILFVWGASPSFSAEFAKETEGLEHKPGLVDLYVDHARARTLLAFDAPDEQGVLGRYIYATYLTGGLGSNPMGLDRSVPNGSEIILFRQVGDKVVAMIENHRFRASADNPAEKRAVETSFAKSIIWSGKLLATDDESGKRLVDISSFLMRDATGVAARLGARGQGSFSLKPDHSYVDTRAAFMFPINGEFDAYVTFTGKNPGREVQTTTPVPEAVTLIAHTTLRALPDGGFQARRFDARGGVLSHEFVDMSAGLDGDVVTRLAPRFRLEKDADGKVINPIVFYIDNGAPEPIRSALQEGANWWADAFEAAGYPGGYRVEILPEGVHPLDARYNVVNWVHRATRGWSYGAALTDPRTGEILRGVVLLGSLRVRQDIKIFEALAGAGKTGTGTADDPVQIALGRIRQLAAHEVGHSIGFTHNMAGSSYGGRASVMDYPAPDIHARKDGTLDFSDAYGVGMGAWDMWTVKFLYGDYADESDAEAQAGLVAEADKAGLIFVSDPDSRPVDSGNIRGALWDNGEDALTSLENVMKVRRIALDRFGAGNLRKGEDASALQTKFVPLYLYHRYQLQAAAKLIGGADFAYRTEGDGRAVPVRVAWERQRAAIEALLGTVTPETLDIREELLMELSPLGYAVGDPQFNRETFADSLRPMFDLMGAAAVATDLSFDALLAPARLARLHVQGLGEDYPTLDQVLGTITDGVLGKPFSNTRHEALRQQLAGQYAERLIGLSLGPDVAVAVRQASLAALMELKKRVAKGRRSHSSFSDGLVARIEDALARARTPAVKEPSGPPVPPGSPIGGYETCWHCGVTP
ncbi:MAG: zinc-dependent metalloprotease [Alphaproteobacteria bacterium]|nr:zinc-dependent metalloprotease [Alphaproteobacteria bacterium]